MAAVRSRIYSWLYSMHTVPLCGAYLCVVRTTQLPVGSGLGMRLNMHTAKKV